MREPSHVLHIVPALFGANDGITGGAERYAFELARHMAREVPTTILSFGVKDRQERIDELEIRIIGNPWYVRGQRTNPMALSLFSEMRRADVIHCHQQHVLASSVAAAFGRLFGHRVFVTDLGGGGWDISGYISTDSWYQGHLHISEYSRRIYRHEGKPWAHVIMGGVDTEKFSPGLQVTRENKVRFVGRLLPHKGIDYLIEALPEGMALDIVGHPYDSNYAHDLRRLARAKQVTFIEDCDDAALVTAYRRALCVVLPSVYKNMYGRETKVPELLGQTLLEGMACATPVICTDVASMPEIVEDNVTGFIVPPNDAAALSQKLIWLFEHPMEARKMGEMARRRVLEKFTWPLVVRRCLEIYAR
jgi:alpha-maltose-1-phosphate synthase